MKFLTVYDFLTFKILKLLENMRRALTPLQFQMHLNPRDLCKAQSLIIRQEVLDNRQVSKFQLDFY